MRRTLSEYIVELQKLEREGHGNLPVQKWMPAKGRHNAPAPVVAFTRVWPAKRGTEDPSPQFFNEENDTPAQRGDPVIRI